MLRVLLVDDHPGTTEALATLLQMLGHETHAVARGADALSAARELDPDLIMLDISLPDMSGLEVARKLRAERGHRSYIAATTAWGRPCDRARTAEAGFDLHMTKPFELPAIRELLRLARKQKAASPVCWATRTPRPTMP